MDFETGLPFALSVSFDAAVVCALAWWAVRARPPLGHLALACAAALALLAAKGVAMVLAGLHIPFGVAHVLWLDIAVVAPLAGATVLLAGWRDGWAVRIVGFAGLALAPVAVYASFVEPSRLVDERATVALGPERAGSDPVTIAVLADLQFDRLGDHERAAVDRALAARPDVILLAGDYYHGDAAGFERELPELRRLLARLDAPGGVFAVQGDTDSLSGAARIFQGTGVRLLVNETAATRVGDRELSIAGLELRHWTGAARRAVAAFERRPGRGDVRIVLAHRPDPVLRLTPASRVDLVVSGHTHGGQVQLPLLGPIATATGVPRTVAAGGLHDLDGRRIYVSRGIGVERGQAPRIRFGAPPEVSVLELR